jgi:hypothetical protein
MDWKQYYEYKKVLPQNFEFDEEFDPNCFEEDTRETVPPILIS